jgi:hypothetical protein
LKKIGLVIEEGEKYRRALGCLQAIPRFQSGLDLCAELDQLSKMIPRCRLQGRLAPEITPICPSCGFVIGTRSPRERLSDITAGLKRILEGKLAELSQQVIRRLLRHHGKGHRLEGFLKMTQAAQAGALIDMIDDELVAYLAKLLDEGSEAATGKVIAKFVRPPVEAMQRSGTTRRHRRGH